MDVIYFCSISRLIVSDVTHSTGRESRLRLFPRTLSVDAPLGLFLTSQLHFPGTRHPGGELYWRPTFI